MKFYIALGGIGCRTLAAYQKEHGTDAEQRFLYIDHEPHAEQHGCYVVSRGHSAFGTGALRSIGRNTVNYEIHSGAMDDFFAEIGRSPNVELVFVLSSFGGFGGAAVSPVIVHLEALCWENFRSCTVLAFNENAWRAAGFPRSFMDHAESNTIEFVSELLPMEHGAARDTNRFAGRGLFDPNCRLYLVDTQGMGIDELWKCMELPAEKLAELNCARNYHARRLHGENTLHERPDVFISYSTADQAIADQIADGLAAAGIVPWIATRNIGTGSYAAQIMQGIREAGVFLLLVSANSLRSDHVRNEIDRAHSRLKDGMKIIPFMLDDAELDDECSYYLCRQEKISGKNPPLEQRIEELVNRIAEVI